MVVTDEFGHEACKDAVRKLPGLPTSDCYLRKAIDLPVTLTCVADPCEYRPRDLRSTTETDGRMRGDGPSRALDPMPGASRPATDDLPRTGTSDRGRTLRTWESEPAAQASGPRDPRLGLRKFSAWPPMRRVGPSRALDPMPGAPRPAGPTTDDRRPTEDRDL